MIKLVPSSAAHIGRVANRMREMDVRECAAQGHSPREALRLSIRASVDTYTVKIGGEPEAMLGLTPENLIEGRGRPWMLGSDALYENARAMLSLGPPIIRLWRDSTPVLVNVVWQENARAIRMLRRWGFEIGSEVEMIGGLAFVRFTMGA